MIWIIGDVHGRFDPLRRVITEIRIVEERSGEKVDKIVFVGDYIDHGPASKEVLDLVLGLDYPTAPLMGNHEDMAVRMSRPDPFFVKEFPDSWSDHGASETLASLRGPRRAKPGSGSGPGPPEDGRPAARPSDDLFPKYARALSKLKYSHREPIRHGGRLVPVTIMHGLPNPLTPLAAQRVFDTYEGFTEGLLPKPPAASPRKRDWRRYRYALFWSFVWGRDYDFDRGYGGDLLVHGHTPTIHYPHLYDYPLSDRHRPFWAQFERFPNQLRLPFVFSRSPGARLVAEPPPHPAPASLLSESDGRPWWEGGRHFAYETVGETGIEAINVDTGLVDGGSLTALGLSERCLADDHLIFLSCPADGGWRRRRPKVIRGSLRFTRLGGPQAADEPGPPAERRKPGRAKRPAP